MSTLAGQRDLMGILQDIDSPNSAVKLVRFLPKGIVNIHGIKEG